MMNKYDVIIVGGGAAGMMAALSALDNKKKVLIIESKSQLGSKILITGKGRCNITNNCDIEDVIKNTMRNGNFMYSSIYSFSNYDIIDFFNRLGVKTKEERGKRIFPVSDNAKDVRDAFLNKFAKSDITILYDSKVDRLLIEGNNIRGVALKNKERYYANSVILACGGKSYPITGSDGSGYGLAKSVGHNIIPPKGALTGLNCKEKWTKDAMGVTLKNVKLTAIYKNKQLFSNIGEMLFTHFGISGPLVLTASRYFLETGYDGAKIIIDLKPGLSKEKLYNRICRDFDENPKKLFENSLRKLLPSNLVVPIVKLSGIASDKQSNQITKEERNKLVDVLKGVKLHVLSGRGFTEAIVTAGGIDTKEINPSTMESKIINGLFFAGEIIDIDAFTGGFNLTLAFSTGHLAGDNAWYM